MAEGGEQLGLAELQLRVDQQGLLDGLEIAKKTIAAFTPNFTAVDAALAELGARIDATFQRLGTLPVGGGAPASTAGEAPPRTSRTIAGAATPAGVSGDKRIVTGLGDIREELAEQTTKLSRGTKAPGVTVNAPQVLTRSLNIPQRAQSDAALQAKTLQAIQALREAREQFTQLQKSRPRTEQGRQQKAQALEVLDAKLQGFEKLIAGLATDVKPRLPKPGVSDVIRSEAARRAPREITPPAGAPDRGVSAPGTGGLERSFAALKATCDQLQACFLEFLPACKAAAEALRGIAAGGRGATGVTAAAPRSTAGSPSRPRPRTITPSSENRLLNFADAASAPDSNATLRQLRRARSLLLDQREGAEAGSPRSQRLTDSINRLSTRIDRAVKVGRETQGVEGIRPNAKERLQNFQRPARASVESLERRGAPQRTTQELRDLIGRVSKAQGAPDFGAAERARREFDSRLRTARIRQSTTERTAIGDRRERLDEFRTVRDISNEQFQLNRAKAQGVNITEAQVRLDRAAQLAKEGRRQEARDYVLQSRETRRNTQLEVQTLQKREREERAQRTQREAAKDRGSRLDRSIREIEQRSPALLKQSGVNPQLLRRDLGAVREAQAKGDFESAKSLGAELRRRITSSLDKLRAFEAEINKGFKQAPRTGGLEQGRRAGTRVDDLEQRVTKLKSQGFDTKPFEEGIAQARKKLVEGQLLSAQRQIESISRRVKADESFSREDSRVRRSFESEIGRRARIGGAAEPISGRKTLEGSPAFLKQQAIDAAAARRAAEQEAKRQAAEQRAADRRATVPAISTETRERLAAQLQNKQLDVEKLGDIGGNTERFKARLEKARQDLLDGNVRAVEREIRRLGPDLRQATATTKRDNAAAKAPLSFGSAQEAAAFAPRIDTPAQLKQYEAALKALKAQTAATDGAFNPLNAVLKQVSATLKGGTSDAAAFAGGLKKVREEAARVKPPQLGAPLPPPRPGAPPPPPRPPIGRTRDALEAEEERRRQTRERRLQQIQELRRRQKEGEELRGRFGDAFSSGVIGGAFPLLFGQGAGAGAGGLIGGAGGGLAGGGLGFGLALVGTAIGSAVDQLKLRFDELAQALQSPIASLDVFIQKAVLASRAQEDYVRALIESGQTAEAERVIREEAGRTVDPVQALATSTVNDELARQFSNLQDILAGLVSGPILVLNSQLLALLKTFGLGAAPQTPQFGAQVAQAGENQRQRGFRNLGLGAAQLQVNPLGGVGSIASGIGDITVGSFRKQTASDPAILRDNKALEVSLNKQADIQKRINGFRAQGLPALAESLSFANREAAVRAEADRKRSEITFAQQTKVIDPKEAARRRADVQRTQELSLTTIDAERKGAAKESQKALGLSERELKNTKSLVGLIGSARDIEQQRQRIAEARLQADKAQETVDQAIDGGIANKDPQALQVLREQAAIAENNYSRVVLEESEKRRRIIASENTQRLESLLQLQQIQDRLQVANLGPSLSGDSRQALEAVNSIRRAYEEAAIAQARLAEDPGNPQLLTASQVATQNIALASAEAKNSLIQAFQNAQQAVQAISRSVEDAELKLSELRGGDQGVNKFLSGQALQNRQQAEFGRLLPQFLAVREQLARQQNDPIAAQGIRSVSFSGSVGDVNRSIIDFIRSSREEMRTQQDTERLTIERESLIQNANLIASIAASSEINTSLNSSVATLTGAVAGLIDKDWNVVVNVAPPLVPQTPYY